MARTTADKVKKIIEVDEDVTSDLTPFIDTANILVTEAISGKGYSTEHAELIERWLAAHFYAIKDPRATEDEAGEARQKVQSKIDLNLDLTHYGQQAKILDWEGGLTDLSNRSKGKTKLGVHWIGTSSPERDDL